MVLRYLSEAFRPVGANFGTSATGTAGKVQGFSNLSGMSTNRLVGASGADFSPTLKAGPGGPGGQDKGLNWFGLPSGQSVSVSGTSQRFTGPAGIRWDSDTEAQMALLFKKSEHSDDVWQVGASVEHKVEYDKYVEVGAGKGQVAQPYFQPAFQFMMARQPRHLRRVMYSNLTMNGALKKMAEDMEKEMKRVIKKKDIIDTGNLLRSVGKEKVEEGSGVLRTENSATDLSRANTSNITTVSPANTPSNVTLSNKFI